MLLKTILYLFSSVAMQGAKISAANTKGADKNCMGPVKSGPNFRPILKEGPKKARTFSLADEFFV
jgi:hypothetical protein